MWHAQWTKFDEAIWHAYVEDMDVGTLQAGATVRVRAFGGKLLDRKVVGIRDNVVLITTDHEIQRASEEGREPYTLGWSPEDVLEVLSA